MQSQVAKPAQIAMLKMDFPAMSGMPPEEDLEDLFYEDIPRWQQEELPEDGDGSGSSGSNSKKGTTVKVPDMLKYFEGDLLRSLDPHVVFCWLRKAATFQSLSAPARKEFQANWWQTVSSSIMPALQRANYVNVRHSKLTSGLSIENGLVFARVRGARAPTRFGPPQGWTLDTTTRFEQLSYRPFVALLKLICVPRDKTRFHQLFVHMVIAFCQGDRASEVRTHRYHHHAPAVRGILDLYGGAPYHLPGDLRVVQMGAQGVRLQTASAPLLRHMWLAEYTAAYLGRAR